MWQDREKAQEEAALDVWIPQRTNERLAEENPTAVQAVPRRRIARGCVRLDHQP